MIGRTVYAAAVLALLFCSAIYADENDPIRMEVAVGHDFDIESLSRSEAILLLKEIASKDPYSFQSAVSNERHESKDRKKKVSGIYEALESIYNLLDGVNWKRQENWGDRSVCYCEWEGVSCASCDDASCELEECAVVSLNLVSNNLSGQLASAAVPIEKLLDLQKLFLDGNRLTGTMFNLNLPFLQELYISGNLLLGSVPSFSSLSSLQKLDLSDNTFTQHLPHFQMPDLEFLDVSNNRLADDFPKLDIFPKIRTLVGANNAFSQAFPDFYEPVMLDYYDFYNNELSSVLSDKQNTRAPQFINLGFNDITGLLPQLKNISNVQFLYLQNNRIEGVFNEQCSMPDLLELNINNNLLGGSIPKTISLPLIRTLYLANNTIGDVVPDAAGFETLVRVDLSGNKFVGIFQNSSSLTLEEINLSNNMLQGNVQNIYFPNLVKLDLSYNQLVGPACAFSILESLQELSISGNGFSGPAPEYRNLKNLARFDAESNRFSGTVPDYEFQSLFRINLKNNMLNGTLPQFKGSPMLQEIYLGGNKISGSIPNFELSSLRIIDLSSNNLDGELPAFDKLVALEKIVISFNKLIGTTPNFDQSPRLSYIAIHGNMLTGSLPSYQNLQKLVYLCLADNRLSGQLPSNLNEHLVTLDISNNTIEGNISPINKLTNITYLNIGYNRFSGTLPAYLASFLFLRELILDDNEFSGTITSRLLESPRLTHLSIANNLIRDNLASFIPSTLSASGLPLKILNLGNNFISGTFSTSVQRYLSDLDEINLSGNDVIAISEVPENVQWKSLDLSKNPLTGSIPESLANANSLYVVSFRGTNLRAPDLQNPELPAFLKISENVLQYPAGKLYYCPQIVGTERNLIAFMDPEYYSYVFCMCVPGSVGQGNRCVSCSSDCSCPGGLIVSGCYPSPNQNAPESVDICLRDGACNPNSKEVFECAEGYEDRLCSKCSNGYHRLGRDCRECLPGIEFLGPAVVVVFLGIYIYALWVVAAPTSGLFRLTVAHAQFLTILALNTLNLPISVTQFVEVFSPVSNLVFPARECTYGPSSPYLNLLVSGLRSFAFLAASLVASLFVSPENWRKIVSITAGFFHLMYFDVARRSFGAIGCTTNDSSGVYYLTNYPWIQCDPASSEYSDMYAVAIPLMILHVVGYPLLVAYILFRNRKTYTQQQFKEKYGYLFACYQNDYYYWELIILVRKLLLGLVMGLVPYTDSAVFSFLIVLILQASVWLHIRHKPFISKRDNRMELWSLNAQVLTIILAFLISFVDNQEWLSAFIIMVNVVTMLILFFVLMQRSTDEERESTPQTAVTATSTTPVSPSGVSKYRSYKESFTETRSLMYRLPDSV